MTFLTGQFSIDLNRLRNRDEFAIESFVAKYEPFIRRSIRFRLARSSLGAAADSVDVYWFQFEVATQTLSLESDQDYFHNTVGGATRIRFDHSGGYLVGYDWGIDVMLLDSFRKRKIASGGGRTFFDRLAPKIDPLGQLIGFAPSLDHPTQVGTMKVAPCDEFPSLFCDDQDEYAHSYSRMDPTGSFVIIPGLNGFVIIDVARFAYSVFE